MKNSDFFARIPQAKVPLGDRQISVPVFCYETLSLTAFFLVPMKTIRSILPSERMHPYRVTPWHSVVAFSAYEYKDSDIGPYNEVSIAFPFTLDMPSPLFTGMLRKPPDEPLVYIHHLPVTTEIALTAGIEFANFPKFLADIRFETKDEWIRCQVNSDGKDILTITGRKIELGASTRQRMYPVTLKKDHLLRLELILSECKMGTSRVQSDAKLELGNHPIAEELKDWHMGKMILYQYCPTRQSILTPVFESYNLQS